MSFSFEREGIRIAIRSVRERKLRSSLTVIGIAIGIAAIVSLVSIGDGTNRYIQEQFEQLGANKIIISPAIGTGGGFISPVPLRQSDMDMIKKVRGVDEAIEMLYKTLPVDHKDQVVQMQVVGLNAEDSKQFFSDIQSFELENGRFFRTGDRYVVIVGNLAAKKSFEEEIRIRDKITIEEREFTVIGILKEIGNSQDDTMLIIPLDVMRDVLGEQDEISYIYASAKDTTEVEKVADDIQDKLDEEYGEDSFMVLSTSQLAGQVSSIMSTLSSILGGVAGISLLVAGVGISNTMYMSTLERTKEIGIMKSVGATNTNILKIFLIESAIIGIVGGALGILLGTLLSKLIGVALGSYGIGLKTYVTIQLMMLGMMFAVVVGVISGFLPAKSAAELDPIEALRYE